MPRARKPFIKWVGGKNRLLPKILPYAPERFANYHEPFLGGGAMFYAIQDRIAGRAHLTDLNEELVNAWIAVRDHHDELRDLLAWYKANDSKDFYYEVRPMAPLGGVARAARFIYLNQTSWNGLWRVNKLGQYNVPWGDRPFRGLTDETLDALRNTLGVADIHFGDFRDAMQRVKPGDFVYLDPPYLRISDTSKFDLYTEKRFRLPDLTELAEFCSDMTQRGVKWIMSNRDTESVRELFDGADMVALTTTRGVAAQNKRDVEARQSPEIIVVGR